MIARVHLPDKCFLVISLLEVGLLGMVAARFEKKSVLQGHEHGTERNISQISSSTQVHDLRFVPNRFCRIRRCLEDRMTPY
jgi:hypothetical protein